MNSAQRPLLSEVILKHSTLIPTPPHRLLCRGLPIVCLALALGPVAFSQSTLLPPQPPPVPPPVQSPSPAVIARVTAAKTIFLSNAGANDSFNNEIPGGPNVAYNELYAALQQWGYFQLVDSPSHADLIFQIRCTELPPNLAETLDGQHIIAEQHAPHLEVTILDTASNTPVDTITTLAGRGTNLPKGTIAFAQSIEWLTYQISTRVNAPRADSGKLHSRETLRPSFESLIHSEAPVPPQVLSARNIYVINDSPASAQPFQAFTTALTTWNYYHLTDAAQTADILLRFHSTEANGTYLTLEDPSTKAVLWTITDPHYGFYRQQGKHRTEALIQNLISLLKQLNHVALTPSETAALH